MARLATADISAARLRPVSGWGIPTTQIILWPSCPRPGFATLMQLEAWPPRYWVIRWSGGMSALCARLEDSNWIAATLGSAGVAGRGSGRAIPQDRTVEDGGLWRHVVRVPGAVLDDLEPVARFVVGTNPGMHCNPTVWIDAPRVTVNVLKQAEALEQECQRLQDAGVGVTVGVPITLIHGSLEGCEQAELLRFAQRPHRAIVAVIARADEVPGRIAADTRAVVRRLAAAGAVVPVELHMSVRDQGACLDACFEWTELNRLAGLLLTPTQQAGLGADPSGFASLLLKLYDLEVLPSSRLFPVNLALAALSGTLVPALFAADPLGEAVEHVCVPNRIDVTGVHEDEGTFAQLLRCWERYGVVLPPAGSPAFGWLEAMARPLYRRLVGQLAEKLFTSAARPTGSGPAPTRRRASVSEGRLRVERYALGPAEGTGANGDRGAREFPGGGGIGPGQAARSMLLLNHNGWSGPVVRRRSRGRRHHPQSLPRHMAINVVDLDITKQCNLRCVYCFKSGTVHPRAERMSLEAARAAVDWLIDASVGVKQLWVHLMGGEPLVAWETVEQLVPYAKLKAGTHGAGIQFGVTTNLTLVTEQVLDFSRRWGMGWHCSIDGIPEMQNAQRPRAGGGPSAPAAERGAKLILSYRRNACARATVTPQFVDRIHESLLYFESLGFVHFGFAMADESSWTSRDFEEYDHQWGLIADHVIRRFREGTRLMVSAFDWIIEKVVAGAERQYSCGAGRGSVMVDYNGDLWPCHRWDGADLDSGGKRQWRLGNIFEPGFNDELHLALLDRDRSMAQQIGCDDCPLEHLCAGGCPAANLSLTGNIYHTHSSDCRVGRILYGHAMRVHDTLKAEQNTTFLEAFYGEEKPKLEIVTDGLA